MTDKEEAAINQIFLQSCWDGNKEKVKACLTLEADVNRVGKARGEPADKVPSCGLKKAAVGGFIDVVDLLLTVPGIDINQPNEIGDTTLHSSCYSTRNLSRIIVKLCGDPRIKLNEKDNSGRTPAFLAVKNGSLENMIALKNVPMVNWNIKNKRGNSPLMLAVKNKNAEKIAELVKISGIDLTTTNKSGQTLEQVAR